MSRIVYFLRRALRGMREAPFVNAVAVLTIAIALFLVAVFGGVLGQVEALVGAWTEEQVVTVYLKPDATAEQKVAVSEAVHRLAGADARLEQVSREAALARLRSSLGEDASVLDGLEENPLPESIEVRGAAALSSPEGARRFAGEVEALAGVDEVDWGREWAERLERLLELVSLLGTIVGAFVLLAAAVMVSNTIKLAVFARRDEIEIMKLCGATDAFVRAPFVLEGLLQGILGATIAVALAALVWVVVAPDLAGVVAETFALQVEPELPTRALLGLWGAGAGLGVVGSLLSLGRFLRV